MKTRPDGLWQRIGRVGLLACAIAMAAAGLSHASPPTVAAERRAELRAYVESGHYDRDIRCVAIEAGDWLRARTSRGGGKLVAVFDIDDTLLSNLPVFQRTDYAPGAADWTEWEATGEAPVIAPVLALLRAAHAANVEIVLLTGRHERRRNVTLKNLRSAGIEFPFELIMKPATHQGRTGEFKERIRRELIARGATIILNIGDQASDLAGGFAERTFKLPNPFYLTR